MEEGECESDSMLPDKASTTSVEVERNDERPRRRPLPFEVSRELMQRVHLSRDRSRSRSSRERSRTRSRSLERSRDREKKKHKRKKARDKSRSRTPKRKRRSRSRERTHETSRDKHKRRSSAKSDDVIEIESDDGLNDGPALLPPARDKFVSSRQNINNSDCYD